MQPFAYANPGTVQEAVALLGSRWGQTDVLAGGTDLLSLMKEHLHEPKRVVNIKSIKELEGITKTADGIRIGALVTMDELAKHADVPKSLSEAAAGVPSPQIRHMGTAGGDLCQRPRCWYYRQGMGLLAMKDGKSLVAEGENQYHAIFGDGPAYFVSASSLGPALVALGAKVTVMSASGKRDVAVEQFFVAPSNADQREVALQPNELVTEVVIPAGATRNAVHEIRERDAMDWPLVAAAVALKMQGDTVQSGRVVLGHVAPTPYVAAAAEKALAGKKIDEASAEEIGRAAVEGAKPLSQNGYKVQLAKVAVKRALLEAAGKKA